MVNIQRFPFLQKYDEFGRAESFPYLPLTLTYRERPLDVLGLLDTGSSVSVLPYEIGLQLGAVWEQQSASVTLTGNLARFPARGLLLSATVGQFEPVSLVFAWTQSEEVPLLLGRLNFFQEFDVCFYGSQLAFEVSPRQMP